MYAFFDVAWAVVAAGFSIVNGTELAVMLLVDDMSWHCSPLALAELGVKFMN